MGRKKKRTIRDNTIIAVCGPTFAILLIVIAMLIANYIVRERKEVGSALTQRLLDNSNTCVDDLEKLYVKVASIDSLVAHSLSNTDCEQSDFEYSVNLLVNAVDEVYMTAIVDDEGRGVCSGMAGEINISHTGYFSAHSQQQVFFVENDGIIGRQAMVSLVPIYKDSERIGSIYSYIETKTVDAIFPIRDYDKQTYFALVDDFGNILYENGQSVFSGDGNVCAALENASIDKVGYAAVISKIKSNTPQHFSAKLGEESRFIITNPIRVCDWTYYEAINQSYYNGNIDQYISRSYELARQLGWAIVITGLVIVCMFWYNKRKIDEQSKMLEDKADTDLLTGISNKLATERKIKEYIEENPGLQGLFILLDVDDFKKINDTKGHAFGDLVLKNLGEQLSKEFRSSDIIGRVGGDEFILFLKNLNSDELIAKEAGRIIKLFDDFSVGDYVKYSPTASIGGAVYPRDGESFMELYKAADAALYNSKKNGKNQLSMYDSSMSNSGRKD